MSRDFGLPRPRCCQHRKERPLAVKTDVTVNVLDPAGLARRLVARACRVETRLATPVMDRTAGAPTILFVALPVAALIVGMQTLVCAVNYFVAGPKVADWANVFGYAMFLLGSAQLFLFSSYSFAPFGYLFLAALTFSGFMLVWVLSDDKDWGEPAGQTRRHLAAIALLSAFVLAWAGGWYVVGFTWLAAWPTR
jgi:hypothetical protein